MNAGIANRLAFVGTVSETRPSGEPSLIHQLLAEQRDMTAVERFASQSELGGRSFNQERYRALLPLETPRAGEQYAFEVDLDGCTGCKACVTGCHSLNGLDEAEIWRTVGLLHGGTPEAPVLQTITTACHHCVDPACMNGCPVKAYEKDPITGIVKHLDDQCIGCQYCIFMCPYDAPKFSRERGIVRKCDMCSDRLAHSEAPACVQACPNGAIRITVVDQAQAIEAAQASAFLPGAPTPSGTLPTTQYQTAKALPRNLLPADFYSVNPEHSHPALMVMLVFTQLAVGAFCVDLVVREILGPSAAGERSTSNALFALGLSLAAMTASVFHLGRPRYGFRAVLGLRTSWLSREIIGFSVFAALAALYSLTFWLSAARATQRLHSALEWAVAVSGLMAVGCSVMVYAVTRRECWRAHATGFKFLTSTLLLGAATVLLTSASAGVVGPPQGGGLGVTRTLWLVMIGAMATKLLWELTVFRHLKSWHHSALKRSAILMANDLYRATWWRFVCGALGGVALPAFMLLAAPSADERVVLLIVAIFVFALSLAGELLERYLFFAAATAPKMPGGLA